MKLGKILLIAVLILAIASQLYSIITKIGLPNEFNTGFIIGKVIIIIGLFILGRFALKAINQRTS